MIPVNASVIVLYTGKPLTTPVRILTLTIAFLMHILIHTHPLHPTKPFTAHTGRKMDKDRATGSLCSFI